MVAGKQIQHGRVVTLKPLITLNVYHKPTTTAPSISLNVSLNLA